LYRRDFDVVKATRLCNITRREYDPPCDDDASHNGMKIPHAGRLKSAGFIYLMGDANRFDLHTFPRSPLVFLPLSAATQPRFKNWKSR
jgi:hypothetical protein